MRAATIAGLLLAAALAGCGAAPLDYHPASEIPRGPGLFTGERGALVVRIEDSEEYREFREWKQQKEKRDTTP